VEKIMYNRLISHFEKYEILNPNQYGYQKKLSTDNAVYSLLNKILTGMNNKLKVKGIFCDMEKAFDCVNHNIFLHKREIYGITGIPKKLFTNYLKDRYQRIILKDNATL
jgi:transposase-like protein